MTIALPPAAALDDLQAARAALAALEAELADLDTRLPALREDGALLAEIQRQAASHPDVVHARLVETPTASGLPWSKVSAELASLEHRRPGLVTARRRQREVLERLEAERIPDVDDAIDDARAQMAAIPEAIARHEAALASAEWRQGQLEASRAIGEDLPKGEPAATAAAIVAARQAVAALAADRARLERLVPALLERRADRVGEIVEAQSRELEERWSALAAEANDLVVRLVAIGADLDAVETAYRAAGARAGERRRRIGSVSDQRLGTWELEQLAAWARGLALRMEA